MLNTDQKSSFLYKHNLGVADTRTNRDFYEEAIKSSFCVRPDQLLMYGDEIPKGESEGSISLIKNLKDGEYFNFQKDETTVIHVVQFHEDYPLQKIDDGTDNSFKLIDSSGDIIRNIIPFNYYKDLYNYSLKTSTGKKIYFGVGDWILDTYSGVLTFYGDVPTGVDHDNPPTISFYQYVGGTGFRQDTFGYDGVILPIENWHISKGTCIIDNTNTTDDGDITLEDKIVSIANKIQDNYAAIFGFDGNDKNEGIAYSLEPVISLTYTASKDEVKGYDASDSSEIGSILTRLSGTISDATEITLLFSSNNIDLTTSHKITVDSGAITFDSGKSKTYTSDSIVKLSDGNGNFIVLKIGDATKITDAEYTMTFKTGTTSGLLIYWDKVAQEYLPFLTNEDDYYNFGFPVVASNGRIPPSVSLSSILNSYSDSITPDYYGPRNYSVTIALESGTHVKSADYIVKNKLGYYLNDIFNQIITDYTDSSDNALHFSGTVFLRAGEYKVDADLDLSKFTNLTIVCEDFGSTKITGGKLILGNTTDGLITINDMNVPNIDFTSDTQNLILNHVLCGTFKGVKSKNSVIIKNSSMDNIEISGNITPSETDIDTVYTSILGNILGTVDVSIGYTLYSANVISSLKLSDVKNDVVKSCYIDTVYNKPHQTNIWESTVINYNGVPFSEIPHMCYFPIFAQDSDKTIEYAKFENPFEVSYDSESGNSIKLKIDDKYFFLLEDGKLSMSVNAAQITVDPSKFTRNEHYEGTTPVEAIPNKTLEEALIDIYKTKSDLNPDGKVPLEQLPDSVAYGGLLLVGTWSFEYLDKVNGKSEENYYVDGGPYPTYDDCIKNLTVDQTQLGIIEPGWFFIVDSSKKNVDYPAATQTAALLSGQTTPTIFTAGDWVICAGKKENVTYDMSFLKTTQMYYGTVDGNSIYISIKGTDLEYGLVSTVDGTATYDIKGTGANVSVSDDNVITFDYTAIDTTFTALASPLTFVSTDGTNVVFTDGNNTNMSLESQYSITKTVSYDYIWEKLDRAYQDVAYMILPIYTTGEHLCWSWRNAGETGKTWGLGALELGGETIAESFDMVNQELRKLWVKHPAILSNITLVPFYDDYKTLNYYQLANSSISAALSTAYDLHKDNRIETFRVKTPETTDNQWKSSVFVGDSCSFETSVDGALEDVNYTPSDEYTDTDIHISKAIDPFDSEIAGSGYWKSVYVDFKGKDAIVKGGHNYLLSMTNITPSNDFTKDAICSTDVYSMSVVSPYDLTSDTFYAKLGTSKTLNSTQIETAIGNGVCSGIKTLIDDKITLRFNFGIESAIDGNINASRYIVSLLDETHNIETIIPESCISFVENSTTGMYDVKVSNFEYDFLNDKIYTSEVFSVYVYDAYTNKKTIGTVYSLTILTTPGIKESERVYSSIGLNPTFNTASSNACGYPYDSSLSLESGYTTELLKVGRLYNDSFITEYKWPDGNYSTFNDSMNYLNIKTGDETVATDTKYRWVTFTKFWNGTDWESVVLDEASGFTMSFDVADDVVSNWTFDEYSITTDNIIIQAKLVNPLTEEDQSLTKWIDCNSPYDGFADVGLIDNQAGMYAGSSSNVTKRITFGKGTYSGTLVVRIGIKYGSNLSFEHLNIKDII